MGRLSSNHSKYSANTSPWVIILGLTNRMKLSLVVMDWGGFLNLSGLGLSLDIPQSALY